jgi:hypothetical protein
VLQMAAEAPDFLMSSIVFQASGYYQRKANGHKKPLLAETDYDASLPVYVEFDAETGAAHYNTDLVEDGAATSSLFGTEANRRLFAVRAHEWLDQNPDIQKFITENPEKVQEFLLRLGLSKRKNMENFSWKKWLFGESDAEPDAEALAALRAELESAKSAIVALKADKDGLSTENAGLQASLQAPVAGTSLSRKPMPGLK